VERQKEKSAKERRGEKEKEEKKKIREMPVRKYGGDLFFFFFFFFFFYVFIFSQLTRLVCGDLCFGEVFGKIVLLVKKK